MHPDAAAPVALPALTLAILSRPGGRAYNEDACGHWHGEHGLCCVVADGAGGHGGGDVASRLAVQHILAHYAREPVCSPEQVRQLLVQTNEQVRAHRADAEAQRDMHSTVVAMFVDFQAGGAVWGHVGDSRMYLFRDGRMLAHTRDHSVVQSLVEAGLLSPEQMRGHPQRSELISALGLAPEDLQVATASRAWHLQPGDAFLLCTDGLWEFVDEAEMNACLARAQNPQDWLARLEQCVLRHAAEAGKSQHDNFSGIALWVGPAEA